MDEGKGRKQDGWEEWEMKDGWTTRSEIKIGRRIHGEE